MPIAHLYRLGSVAGLASALVVLVNTIKRAGVIPTSDFTQLVAPLAQIFALALVTALFFAYGLRTSRLATTGFVLNFAAIAALVGVEFVINLVFAELPGATITALRTGPLGVALTSASILFIVGTWAFAAALLRAGGPAKPALALYALGSIPVGLRSMMPEVALEIGLLTLAISITWLAIGLWRDAERLPSTA